MFLTNWNLCDLVMAPCEGREYVEVRLIRRSSLVKEAAWPKEEKMWTAV